MSVRTHNLQSTVHLHYGLIKGHILSILESLAYMQSSWSIEGLLGIHTQKCKWKPICFAHLTRLGKHTELPLPSLQQTCTQQTCYGAISFRTKMLKRCASRLTYNWDWSILASHLSSFPFVWINEIWASRVYFGNCEPQSTELYMFSRCGFRVTGQLYSIVLVVHEVCRLLWFVSLQRLSLDNEF